MISKPNYLAKATPLNSITLGVRDWACEIRNTNTQSMVLGHYESLLKIGIINCIMTIFSFFPNSLIPELPSSLFSVLLLT